VGENCNTKKTNPEAHNVLGKKKCKENGKSGGKKKRVDQVETPKGETRPLPAETKKIGKTRKIFKRPEIKRRDWGGGFGKNGA